MKSWLADILDALRLRGAALAVVADRPDAFMRGLLVIVAAALIVGLPALVSGIAAGFRPLVVEPADIRPDMTGAFDMLRPWLRSSGLPDAVIEQVVEVAQGNTLMAGQIATQIQELPTALPRPVAQAFKSIGAWLSRPFAGSPFPLAVASLATWLGYGIFVMLFAKWLGGRGTLHGFFGATGFYAAPHVLGIFLPIPVVGPILSFVGFAWGVVIYTIATAVSHRLSAGRALVAVFAPVLALLTLFALLLLIMALFALIGSLGGRASL
jgi:hypothetical protein